MPAKSQVSQAQKQDYAEQGYLIIRGAFDAARIRSLVDAVDRLIDRALDGKVALEWIGDSKQRMPERITGMLLPDKYDSACSDWLEADVIPLIESLLGSPVRYSKVGMLTGGGGKPYVQDWHHDLPNPTRVVDPAVVFDHEPFWFTQFNASLKPGDRFLQIIPGSHRRNATPAEAEAFQRKSDGNLPGEMTVELEPGDIALYNANLWHRGFNPQGEFRWTMHSVFWRPDFPVMSHEAGQREALLTPGHLDRMPPRTRRTIQSYLDAYPAQKPQGLLDVFKSRHASL